jgi:succinate dehydrogenase / fumarate reductase, cytochrome b subunit
MKKRRSVISSTIGLKFIMSLTGLLLVGFLFMHMLGNLQFFLGPEAINRYAALLQSLGELLWFARLVILTTLIIHIVTAIRLKLINLSARPDNYLYNNTVQATIASRWMLTSGFIILLYVTGHLAHFTLGLLLPEYFHLADPVDPSRHDVYTMILRGFQNPVVSWFYIIAMIGLAFHLSHGIASALQTLGLNHSRYFAIIQLAGFYLAILIALGFIIIPTSVLMGFVG